jgi:glycosyltransferase involved in cell wall biosynthesis
LIYDTHELETKTYSSQGIQGFLFRNFEKNFIVFADFIFVVNNEIAKWYLENYQLKKCPFVIRNFSDINTVDKLPLEDIRLKFGFSKEDVIFVYVGILSYGRGIDVIIETALANQNKRFKFLFVGFGKSQKRIEKLCEGSEKLFFHPAIHRNKMYSLLQQCDVGLSLIENVSLSYYLCLPNKFSEYIVSGIPVLASNFPEMKNLIESREIGWVIEPTPESFAQFLETMTIGDLDVKKNKCESEKFYFSWESERKVLVAAYNVILS